MSTTTKLEDESSCKYVKVSVDLNDALSVLGNARSVDIDASAILELMCRCFLCRSDDAYFVLWKKYGSDIFDEALFDAFAFMREKLMLVFPGYKPYRDHILFDDDCIETNKLGVFHIRMEECVWELLRQ